MFRDLFGSIFSIFGGMSKIFVLLVGIPVIIAIVEGGVIYYKTQQIKALKKEVALCENAVKASQEMEKYYEDQYNGLREYYKNLTGREDGSDEARESIKSHLHDIGRILNLWGMLNPYGKERHRFSCREGPRARPSQNRAYQTHKGYTTETRRYSIQVRRLGI